MTIHKKDQPHDLWLDTFCPDDAWLEVFCPEDRCAAEAPTNVV
jgi:hypothetical protein